MKILIYGINGWLGSIIKKYLEDDVDNKIEIIEATARGDNLSAVSAELELHQPTHVLCALGRTHGKEINTIDYLEAKDKLYENLRDNLFAPYLIANESASRNIHYTYIGSGCIFSDDMLAETHKKYTEDDDADFFGSAYSTVKGFTDKLMRLDQINILNIRIRMPIIYEDNPRNFITKILKYEHICSIPNSMTVIPTLLPILKDLMIKKHQGTINLCNPGVISHEEILEMYKDIVNKDITWKTFTIEEQNKILAAQRSNNELDTTKISTLYPDVPNIKDAMKECMINMSKI